MNLTANEKMPPLPGKDDMFCCWRLCWYFCLSYSTLILGGILSAYTSAGTKCIFIKFGFKGDILPQAVTIFWNIRLPRILSALFIGASLSVAGATYQGMFRNPLVSPDILGVSSGASLGAALQF